MNEVESNIGDEDHFLERYMCNVDPGTVMIDLPTKRFAHAIKRPLELIAGVMCGPLRDCFVKQVSGWVQ